MKSEYDEMKKAIQKEISNLRFRENLKMLVERATPNKPIDNSFLYECPHCGVSSTIFSHYKFNNCPQCGGKLDWSK